MTARPTYTPAVKAAAKRVRAEVGDDHAPGPKQVDAVIAAMRRLKRARVRSLPALSAAQFVEAATGMTVKKLREYVRSGAITREGRRSLRTFAAEVDDSFAKNRNLAAIVVVLFEEEMT